MTRRTWTDWLIMAVVIAAIGLVVAAWPAWPAWAQVDVPPGPPAAAPDGPYDGSQSDWYKSLRSPGGIPCCDIADCRRVDAEQRDGQWWANSPRWGWQPVPDKAILPGFSIFAEAVLCETQWGPNMHFYCFVRPGQVG